MRLTRRSEQGIALITSLLVMMVCTAVVTASLALATHTEGQSADQRNLTAALHAADYGLQAELASLSGQPGAGGPNCAVVSPALLPNTSLPAEWFSVTMSGCSASSLTPTIISTGYAVGTGSSPPASPPAAALRRTLVAHVTLQPAGATSNGGYGFPDAITALKSTGHAGALSTSSGSPLTVTGLGGYPVSIRAVGPVSLSNGQLTLSSGQTADSLSSWDNITLSANPVTGNLVSAKAVTLTNSNVSGFVDATTINVGSPPSSVGSSRSGTVVLPTQPPPPLFPSPADSGWANWTALTGTSATGVTGTTCPTGTLTGVYVLSATCSITPSALNGPVAVIVNTASTANLTVTLPSYLGPSAAQLYLIVTDGALTLNDAGAAVPVFAYASDTVSVGGTIVGQLIGGNVTTNASTNLIAEAVSTTVGGTPTFPPDFAFPAATAGVPPPTGYVPQLNDEYPCAPGVTIAC